jgi:acetyl esterase/lipase
LKLNRRNLVLGALASGVTARLAAQTPPPHAGASLPVSLSQPTETIDLWPGGAPGMPASPPREIVEERSTNVEFNDRAVAGINTPRMAVFRAAVPNGAAVVITPGGGYRYVVIDKEGYELGRWFAARGVTAFVLFYRLPGDGWAAGPDVALCDAQRALRLVRHHAGDYAIDPERVAAMGFSAGGHVCASLSTRFAVPTYLAVDAADQLSARPMVAAPIYPVISMTLPVAHAGSREQLLGPDPSAALERAYSPQYHVPDDAPPHFLLHAEDDGAVPVANTLELRAALQARSIPVQTHLFAEGGHGFGLRQASGKPVEVWPDLFLRWGQSVGWA